MALDELILALQLLRQPPVQAFYHVPVAYLRKEEYLEERNESSADFDDVSEPQSRDRYAGRILHHRRVDYLGREVGSKLPGVKSA